MAQIYSSRTALRTVVYFCLATGANVQADDAKQVLQVTKVHAGLCVPLGISDAATFRSLTDNGAIVVHGLVTSDADLAAARKAIEDVGVVGLASVERVDSFKRLPYANDLVNLLVADFDRLKDQAPSESEIMRVLAPFGKACLKRGGVWSVTAKPLPTGMDEWRDHDHDSTGNPVSSDSHVSYKNTRVRFYAGPHDTHARERCGMRLAGGRAFYVYTNFRLVQDVGNDNSMTIVCRDASNGTLLWTRQFPTPRLSRMRYKTPYKHAFLADDQALYCQVEVGKPMIRLSAATGQTELEFSQGIVPAAVPDPGRERFHYMARLHEDVLYQAHASRLCALDARTGKLLWQHVAADERNISSIAVSPEQQMLVALHSPQALSLRGSYGAKVGIFHGYDLKTGKVRWTNAEFDGTGYISRLLTSQGLVPMIVEKERVRGKPQEERTAIALRAADGGVVWQVKAGNQDFGHYSIGMVRGEHFFYGSYGGPVYSLKTGERIRKWSARFNTGCHEPRAVGDYILHGDVFIKPLDEQKQSPACPLNVIGTQCDEGVWPGYGKLYGGPQGCGCMNMLGGFVAISSEPIEPEVADRERLELVGRIVSPTSNTDGLAIRPTWPAANEWPMYLANPRRSNAVSTALPAADKLTLLWQAAVATMPDAKVAQDWLLDEHTTGGPVSAPSVAEGKVFLAIPYAHQVRAFDAETSKPVWTFAAGGVVEHPPLVHDGLCYFGSRDGSVYCVRSDTGKLVWRFLAAYNDKKIMRCSQVASPWPVASVLMHDGALYVNAGMHSNVDQGLLFYKLEPRSGRLLWKTRYQAREPKFYGTGESPGLGTFQERPYNRYADLLVTDGKRVYHNMDLLDESGEPTYAVAKRNSARASEKIIDPWVYGGFNGMRSRRTVISARFDPGSLVYKGFGYTKLAFNDKMVFGIPPMKRADRYYMSVALAGGTAIAARADAIDIGPPPLPVSPRRQARWTAESTIELPEGPPVENGMAVAYGRIYLATKRGKLLCFGESSEAKGDN